MRILLLSSGDRVPSSRFRMLPYVQHFRAAGHQCVLASSFPQKYDYFPRLGFRPSQKLKRLTRWWHWLASRCRHDDVIVIDREIFDAPDWAFEERFRRTSKRLVLDLDDAVFQRYPEKFERLAAMADLIICGNHFIEEWARERNDSTLLIPTCVEMAQYPEKDWPNTVGRSVRVGWIGTTANLKYFNVVASALRELATRHDFELRVIVPDAAPLEELDLTGVNVCHVAWDKDTEVDQLREVDIGIMPLFLTNDWDRYKCGLKLIQYMAIGVPTVASPVGVNSSIVSQDGDGFLAATDDEWIRHLGQLIENEELRRRIGAAARKTAAAKYSIEANFPRYEAALNSLLETGNA